MGLAASQGRLLLLTRRKSDLEYRAQQISQKRLQLATQMEDASSKLARRVGNKQMWVNMNIKQGEGQTVSLNLTYDNLMDSIAERDDKGNAKRDTRKYVIRDANNKIVVPYARDNSGKNPEIERIKAMDPGLKDADFVESSTISDASSTNNSLQEGLRNGTYRIQQWSTAENTAETGWHTLPWSGMSNIQDLNYTEDDAAAQAEYDSISHKVQAQDKQLETQQQQIETQHKAVETEIESVQKLVQTNAEKGFKYFS